MSWGADPYAVHDPPRRLHRDSSDGGCHARAEFHGWDRSDQAREGSLGRHLAGTPLVVVAELEGGGDEQPWPIHLSSFLQPYPREFEGAGCDVLSNQWVTHATFGVPQSAILTCGSRLFPALRSIRIRGATAGLGHDTCFGARSARPNARSAPRNGHGYGESVTRQHGRASRREREGWSV